MGFNLKKFPMTSSVMLISLFLLGCTEADKKAKEGIAGDFSQKPAVDAKGSSSAEQSLKETKKEDIFRVDGKFEEVIIIVSDLNSYQGVEKALTDIGGRVIVGNPYESIIAKIPEGKEFFLSTIQGVRLISSKPVEVEKLKGFNEREVKLLEEWNKRFSETKEPTLAPNPPPPPKDAIERPEIKEEELEPNAPRSLPRGLKDGGTF